MKGLDAIRDEQDRIVMTANHRYRVDKRPIPNVTTIIKALDAPALDAWKVRTQVEGTAKAAYAHPPAEDEPQDAYVSRLKALAAEGLEHERIANEAADDGHQVHALIEWRMRTELGQDVPRPEVSEEAAFREAGWVEWAKSVGLKPILAEARVVHRDLWYCGTIDLLAEVNGKIALLDWKRAKGVYESHHLQSIAYRMALESMGCDPMPGYVLLMPPGSDPQLVQCSDSDGARASFLACLTLYRWTQSLRKEAA